MKVHSFMLGSVLLLTAACKENQTFRNQMKLPDSTSPVSSGEEMPNLVSMKKIGYRCDLILEGEVKDIFVRSNNESKNLKLSFHDYLEDGSVSQIFANVGSYKINKADMQQLSAPKGHLKWAGETPAIPTQKYNEMGEKILTATMQIKFNADPLDEFIAQEIKVDGEVVKQESKIVVDMKLSGTLEVTEIVKTGPTEIESRPARPLASIENCEEVQALLLGAL